MSFVEKFRRTPTYVVWPTAVAFSYGCGYLLGCAAMYGIAVSPLARWYGGSQTEWFFTALYLVFSFVYAAVGTLILTCILRQHHAVEKRELWLALPLCFVLPVWITIDQNGLTFYRLYATVAWIVFLIAFFAVWKQCVRMIRRSNETQSSKLREAEVMKARL